MVAVPNAHVVLVRVEAGVLLNTCAAAAALSTGFVWVVVVSIGLLWGVAVGDK